MEEKQTRNSQTFVEFYENQIHTDIHFRVRYAGEFVEQSAHKLVLSVWSPVFADMFYKEASTDTIDLKDLESTTMDVMDASPTAFGAMVKFMYGDVRDITLHRRDVSFLLKLFKLAKQYEVEALRIECHKHILLLQPNETNVFQLMEAASVMGFESVTTKCNYLLETRTTAVLAAVDDLSEFTPSMIRTILNLEQVSFSSSYELVKWIFSWAKSISTVDNPNQGMRSTLDPFLPFLDFLYLTVEQFEHLLEVHPDVISDSEGFRIFRNIVNPGACFPPTWVSSKEKRKYRR